MKTVYTRLGQPHFHHIGSSFSVTTLVHDAVPHAILKELEAERQLALNQINRHYEKSGVERLLIHKAFNTKLELLLNAQRQQEHPLKKGCAANAVMEQIKRWDGEYYHLLAACVMSNHIHLLLDLSIQVPDDWDGVSVIPGYCNLANVLKRIKGGSAYAVNQRCNRQGTLWMKGYYDRTIRSANHLRQATAYIANNPVVAGLVKRWESYPHVYIAEQMLPDW